MAAGARPAVVHLLAAWSPGRRPRRVWLLRGPPTRAFGRGALPACAAERDRPLDAWCLDAAWARRVRPRARAPLCTRCAAGEPCEAWDAATLAARRYRPRAGPVPPPWPTPPATPPPAADAAELGLAWPATRGEVARAGHDAILARHPDRGGDARALQRAVEARDRLLAALPPAAP